MAAVIVAASVAKLDSPATRVSGSNRKIKTLYLEGPKAAQNDWFLLSSYLTALQLTQIVSWRTLTEDSGNAQAIDVATYDSDDYKFTLTSAVTGTAFAFIEYFE